MQDFKRPSDEAISAYVASVQFLIVRANKTAERLQRPTLLDRLRRAWCSLSLHSQARLPN